MVLAATRPGTVRETRSVTDLPGEAAVPGASSLDPEHATCEAVLSPPAPEALACCLLLPSRPQEGPEAPVGQASRSREAEARECDT